MPVQEADSRSNYIGDMSRELALMARDEGLYFLAYLLELARKEAERQEGAVEDSQIYLLDG